LRGGAGALRPATRSTCEVYDYMQEDSAAGPVVPWAVGVTLPHPPCSSSR
jgi:hypothetical protein